jgi:nicotinamidase-related amidase
VQPFFIDLAEVPEATLTRLEHLLLLAGSYNLQVIATFEHPVERNGWLPERLERVFPAEGQRFVKHSFNLCREQEIRDAVEALGVAQCIVAGAETDVCVLQSVLGLLGLGQQVFLVEDCLFTHERNAGPALRRMTQAGAIPTTYKALHYELKGSVDVPSLHEEWNRRPGADGRYVGPYELPEVQPLPDQFRSP